MRAIALDDEQPALEVIDAFCDRLDTVELCRTFTRMNEARSYLTDNPIALIFLDINMPAGSGMDFFRGIQPAPMVIFTTAYSEYAVESYELQAVDYLLKPFTFDRFRQAVDKARKQFEQTSRPESGPDDGYLVFRVDYSLVKVAVADIVFVEGLDNYLKIHLTQGRPLVVRMTMKSMLEKLPAAGFIRVHRSYIVALSHIKSVRNKLISIGSDEIPLSGSYEADFYAVFDKR